MKALRTFGIVFVLSLTSLDSSAADPSVQANKMEVLPDGTTRLSGNVVLSASDTNSKVSSERMTYTADGLILEGNVRFEVGNLVLTTDRAVVSTSNRLEAKMDTAISSSL